MSNDQELQKGIKPPESGQQQEQPEVKDNPADIARAVQKVSPPGTGDQRLQRLATDEQDQGTEPERPNALQGTGELAYFNRLCIQFKQGKISPDNFGEYIKRDALLESRSKRNEKHDYSIQHSRRYSKLQRRCIRKIQIT